MQLAQARLGEFGHRADQGERRRVQGVQRAAHVHDADQTAVARVGDRGAGAGPRVVGAHEVLGGEDLDGAPGDPRGAHTVRTDHALAPVSPEFESEPVGLAQHERAALRPPRPACGIAATTMMWCATSANREQALAEHRQDMPQLRGLAPPLDLVTDQQSGPEVVVEVDSAAQHALPGLLDHRAWREAGGLSGEGGVAHLAQHAGRLGGIGGEPRHVDRRVRHGILPSSLDKTDGFGACEAHTAGPFRPRAPGPVLTAVLIVPLGADGGTQPGRTGRKSCNPLQPWRTAVRGQN